MAENPERALRRAMRTLFGNLTEHRKVAGTAFIDRRTVITDTDAALRAAGGEADDTLDRIARPRLIERELDAFLRLTKQPMPVAYWEELGLEPSDERLRVYQQVPLGDAFAPVAYLDTSIAECERLATYYAVEAGKLAHRGRHFDTIVRAARAKGLPDTATIRDVVNL